MTRGGLLLRGLRWRLPLSIAVWVCGVVVCGGAALGPAFALAASESGLQDVLQDAGAATGLRLQSTLQGSTQLSVAAALARSEGPASRHRMRFRPSSLTTLFLDAKGTGAVAVSMHTRMAYRARVCQQVVLTAGRCPRAPGEAMISARSTAGPFGWQLGGDLTIAATDDSGSVSTRVVGTYRPIDTTSTAWSGVDWFQTGTARDGHPVTDAVFVDRATFARLDPTTIVQEWTDLPLQTGSVRLRDVPELRRQLITGSSDRMIVQSGLAAVLNRAATLEARVDLATALVVAQLCVLGWLVLHQVLIEAVEARSADIALAKLRGFSRWRLLRFGLGEPTLLLVMAIPVGALLGFGAAVALSGAVLRANTPVVLPPVTLIALLLASLGGVAAVTRSARGALNRSVQDQWRRTRTSQRFGRSAVVADAAIGAAAVAGFIAIIALGPDRSGPLVLLAPGLLVAALGLAGARLLPRALGPLVLATAWSRQIPLLLSVRQVVRRPAGLRMIALLTVAVGLAVFGVGGEAVAAANRDARAASEVGAPEVVRLATSPGEHVMAAVHRADPRGSWAAAAATWLPWGGDVNGTVLAIDATRLPAVAATSAGLPHPDALSRALRRGSVPAIIIRGEHLAATIAIRGRRGGPAPTVRFDLRGSDGASFGREAGSALSGSHTYRVEVPCAAGCSLIGLTWVRSVEADATVSGVATVSRIDVDGRRVSAGLTDPRAWRPAVPDGQAADTVSANRDGTSDRFSAEFGGSGGIDHADVLDPVPAVVTPSAVRRSTIGALQGLQASDGAATRLRVVQTAPALPTVGDFGSVVDLSSFQAALPAFAPDAVWSVWLGPRAPADALERLRAAGLALDGRPTSLSARTAELARQGPAVALLLLLVCAVSGALLAVGGTTVSIDAALRRRSYEAAALSMLGAGRRTIYSVNLLEQLLLLGASLAVGVPAGLIALIATLPAIPEFADDTPVPLRFLPPAMPIIAFTVLFAALVVATSAVSAHRVVRAGSAQRLREAEE